MAWGRNNPSRRILKNGMHYRLLGRTGLAVSEISLGGSPLPDWPLLLRIIERGVNYIDTSPSYGNGNSERQAGRLMKTVGRDKLFIGTKFHLRGPWSEESIVRSVEGSLSRLDTDCVDVLLIHGASEPEALTDDRVLGAFDRMKKEGKCRFTGLSCHENHLAVVGRAVDCNRYDVITVGYNIYNIDDGGRADALRGRQTGQDGFQGLLRRAAAKDIGIVAMKTLKSLVRMADWKQLEPLTPQQAMLKWVLADECVSSVVTEMMNMEEMEQDLAVPGMPLNGAESRALARLAASSSRHVCRSCGACRPSCPEHLPIPGILRAWAYMECYGKKDRAREELDGIEARAVLSRCRDCGKCETACPYGLGVRSKFLAVRGFLAA